MRTIGQWMGKAQRMARHFQSGIDEMIRQADLDDVRKEISTLNRDISGSLDPTRPVPKPAPPAPPAAPPVSPANPPAGAEP
jgi:sec-independent protein translocase protein TatB